MKYIVNLVGQEKPKIVEADGFSLQEGWAVFYRNNPESATLAGSFLKHNPVAAFHSSHLSQIDSEGSSE